MKKRLLSPPPPGMTTSTLTRGKRRRSVATSTPKEEEPVTAAATKLGAGGYGVVSGKDYDTLLRTLLDKGGISLRQKQNLVKKTYYRKKDMEQAIRMDTLIKTIDPERVYLKSPIYSQDHTTLQNKDGTKYFLYMRNQGYSMDKKHKNLGSEMNRNRLIGSFYQLLIALCLLDAQSMVHGDIKRSNITIDDRSSLQQEQYKPFTLGLIDFDLLLDCKKTSNVYDMKHPSSIYFLRPLELYYESSLKKLVQYPIPSHLMGMNEYLELLRTTTLFYLNYITINVPYLFPTATKDVQTWIRRVMFCAIAHINFPQYETLQRLLKTLEFHSAEEWDKDRANIKFLMTCWRLLPTINTDYDRVARYPYLDAFWKVYGPNGTYKTLKKDWRKVDTFGLGLVAQYFLGNHRFTNDELNQRFHEFLLDMIHPDPSKRLDASRALREWMEIIKEYDKQQYHRILREIGGNSHLVEIMGDALVGTKTYQIKSR